MGQAKQRKQELGADYGKPMTLPIYDATKEASVIQPFQGGTCEIETCKGEPGRYWIKVRFDAQGGAGIQFEAWKDELHLLAKDINTNFEHCEVSYMPLKASDKRMSPERKLPSIKITHTVEVNSERLSDALGSAASGYWATVEVVPPTEPVLRFPWDTHGDFFSAFLYPGGSWIVTLKDEDDGPINGKTQWTLNLETIQTGLQVLAAKDQEDFQLLLHPDFYEGDGDAGDRFLQYCLFGETVFG